MTKDKEILNKIVMLLSIFFISVSLFVYQVVLTRLYSAALSYHYVFLITSFAILGLGIGSIIAYKIRQRNSNRQAIAKRGRRKELLNQDDLKVQIYKGSLILTLSYIIVFLINYLLPFVSWLFVYIVLGTIPFIVGGYLYSILFTKYSGISGKLYFADLIGSAAGSVAVILLLDNAGMFRTILLLGIIALLPALILPASTRKLKAIGYILPLILMIGLLLPGKQINFIEKNYNGIINNSKKTYGSLKKSGLSPEIVFSEWNAFSRTDVIKIPKRPEDMVLTIDGAANSPMYKFDGDINSLEKYKKDTEFLPFAIGKIDKTLLIGPGGGRDVLYALAGGSKDITAVEINTSSISAAKYFGDYNGNVYNRPEVKVFGEDGRSFVQKSKDKYDVIFLSLVMTNASQGMAYALSENYIYTVEAMRDYLDHLSDNGKIAFLAHGENDLNKIVITAMQALNDRGIPLQKTPDYIGVYSRLMKQHGGNVLHYPVIIIKNKPFTEIESNELLNMAKENQIEPIYSPLVQEQGPLKLIKEKQVSLRNFIKGFKTNVTPATDDNPYFYNFSKGVPSTLILIFVVVSFGSIIMFSLFAFKKGNFKPTMYFSLLGMGFMMIEIPLIQKFILYLGHPTIAFTFVLSALLMGSGIGGLFSNNKLFNRVIKAFYLPPIMVAVITIILLVSLDIIFESTLMLNLTGRILIASVIVMFQGFFMGMPFPRGLKLVGESKRRTMVPVMWGINGVMSVIGSVLSIILSMTIGFSGALITGILIYMLVSLFKDLYTA